LAAACTAAGRVKRSRAQETRNEFGIKRGATHVHITNDSDGESFGKLPMDAKILATMMFVLAPSLALAQSSDQTAAKTKQSGNESGQGQTAGKNGNGSDANGAETPGGGGSDANATTAPSSKPPSPGQ
jgi:hypothetical protein